MALSLPGNRMHRRKSEFKLAGADIKPLLRHHVLPGRMDVAQAALQRRGVQHGACASQRVAIADDIGAGRMDPGASLQRLGEIGLVVEGARDRAAPLTLRLNLEQRASGPQFSGEPAEGMLEYRRVPEIDGREKLAAARAGKR